MASTDRILNLAAYRFVTLDDLATLRDRVEAQALRARLRGTVLLATEGINLVLAGTEPDVAAFLDALGSDARLAGLDVKRSWSQAVPFKRLRVKVKPEIIRMNQATIRPDRATRAPAVSPRTLQRWLTDGVDDEGRPVVTLDTRNDFEVVQGQFVGALNWRLARFSDFPAALHAHAASLRGKTVVSYCTGGIRCEKAAIVMQQAGVEHTHQLDGGILNYFEQVGATHWRGSCFVFDERTALDATLGADAATEPRDVHTTLTEYGSAACRAVRDVLPSSPRKACS